MNYNLVFIDDNMREGLDNPFVRSIGKFKEDANLSVFVDPQEGLNYVLNNLNSRMIVFLDCKFDGYGLQGINVLKKIREQTSLLYIVMMSANAISQIAGLDIIEMINEDFIWFFDRNNGTVKDACDLIDRIKNLWTTRFDCVLEQWLIRHPEDNDKEAYSEAATGKSYTWSDILVELRLQTSVGKSFEQKLNGYYIYQLERSKK
ncbi:MAG: hypothetical protein II670_09910 [Alphaproteobacteria bacterium]|nr:hypothetical protein [Alphaproteobacteria bacterium]